MTIGSFVGVLGVLGFVLVLLVLTLRLVKRYVPLAGGHPASMPLEVVQRLPLGARQSIAIVRIGDKLVAVSVGDGGVRPITELAPPVAAEPAPDLARAPRTSPDFKKLLQSAFRTTALCGMLALSAGTLSAQQKPPAPATEQKVAAKAPAPTTGQKVATKAPAPAGGRADTMIARLAPRLDLRVGNDQSGGLRLSGTVGIVVMMGLLTLIPTLVLMMTGFTRIFIVLQFLRQAIGTQSAPPTQLIAGLSLLLTGFVMAPTLAEVNRTALQPWMDGKMEQAAMLAEGVKPFRAFMLRQTREREIATYMDLSRQPAVTRAEDVPLVVLTSAFVTSELRNAFQIGFALFLPFIVIDVVVASVLMSMGMMMLPPVMISLPFKLLLFVLVDGWTLVVQGLVRSFH